MSYQPCEDCRLMTIAPFLIKLLAGIPACARHFGYRPLRCRASARQMEFRF